MKTELIFIVGNSRSGTTMFSKMLGNHPEIFTFSELHFFERISVPGKGSGWFDIEKAADVFSDLLSIQRESGLLGQREPGRYRQEASAYLKGLGKDRFPEQELLRLFLLYETGKNGKKIACEQTPRNLFYVREILDAYPGAKVINLTRDPRDVLLSQKYRWMRGAMGQTNFPMREKIRSWINYHPYTISRLWRSCIKQAQRLEGTPRFCSLRFEDVTVRPEAEMKRACAFLGVEYVDAMLDIPVEGSSVQRDDNAKRGVDKGAASRWERFGGLGAEEIYICQKMNGDIMRDLGYMVKDDLKVNPLKLAFAYLSFPVKIMLAVVFNLSRSKNIIYSIRKRLGAA